MTDVFTDYHAAYEEAKRQAALYRRPMGLEKAREYGREVFRVKMIPAKSQNRYGWETRCQVVEAI